MAFILDDLFKGFGAKSAGKEAFKRGTAENKKQFESDTKGQNNMEDTRQAKAQALMNGLGMLAGGKYAGLMGGGAGENLMRRRQNTAFQHEVIDPSKGAMLNAFGNAINSAGNLATTALVGSGVQKTMDGGAEATSLRPAIGGQPFQLGDKEEWRLK